MSRSTHGHHNLLVEVVSHIWVKFIAFERGNKNGCGFFSRYYLVTKVLNKGLKLLAPGIHVVMKDFDCFCIQHCTVLYCNLICFNLHYLIFSEHGWSCQLRLEGQDWGERVWGSKSRHTRLETVWTEMISSRTSACWSELMNCFEMCVRMVCIMWEKWELEDCDLICCVYQHLCTLSLTYIQVSAACTARDGWWSTSRSGDLCQECTSPLTFPQPSCCTWILWGRLVWWMVIFLII